MKHYELEGKLLSLSRRQFTPEGLRRAQERGTVLEAVAAYCDEAHTLWLDLGGIRGRIPREEAALGVAEVAVREIAVLSRVGRPVCFRVMALRETPDGWLADCSRRMVQQEALEALRTGLRPGDILPATVTGLARFGAFCDIGCGVTALLPTAHIAVAHSRDAAERFAMGQEIYALLRSTDGDRFVLSHRELLGTWRDNAAQFAPEQTVPGVVRGVMPFGVFVELTPNLCGLCEPREDLQFGDRVSVWIKSIQPETQKIKLAVVSKLPPTREPSQYRYLRRSGHMDFWQYAPAVGDREPILTCF